MVSCFILKYITVNKLNKNEGFEWTAVMLNINYGKNKMLMEKCKILRDYAILVDKIRKYHKEETMELFKKEFWEDELKEGEKLGRKKELINLIKDGILSKEQVAERLHISVEQLEQEM